MKADILPILVLTAAPLASAWGLLGHRTVALLSTRYMLPETAVFVRSLLYRDETIMSAATWADRYAHVPLGRYSKAWHYIDAKDDPPRQCGVQFSRDCAGAEGCIVAAIANMTSRIVDPSLPWYQHSQALKFLLHFLGDIHQPLHTEHLDRGGNSIPVLYHNETTNLHTVWDSKIIDEATGGNTNGHATELANLLEERIDSGMYRDKKDLWKICLDVKKAEECAVSWTDDSNKQVCEYVLKGKVREEELSNEYAENAVEIIRELLAMGGYRLAGYLNTIVTGRDGLTDPADLLLSANSAAWKVDYLGKPREEQSRTWNRMESIWKTVWSNYMEEETSAESTEEMEMERAQLLMLDVGHGHGHDQSVLR